MEFEERQRRSKGALVFLGGMAVCFVGSVVMFAMVGGDRAPIEVFIHNQSKNSIFIQERISDNTGKMGDSGDRIEIKPNETSNGEDALHSYRWTLHGYGTKQDYEVWTNARNTGIILDPNSKQEVDRKLVLTYQPETK